MCSTLIVILDLLDRSCLLQCILSQLSCASSGEFFLFYRFCPCRAWVRTWMCPDSG